MDGRKGCFREGKSEPGKARQLSRCAELSSRNESISMIRSVADLLEILNRDNKRMTGGSMLRVMPVLQDGKR